MNVGELRDLVGFYRLVAVDDEVGGFTSAFELMLQDGLDLHNAPVTGDWRDVGRPEDLAAENAVS